METQRRHIVQSATVEALLKPCAQKAFEQAPAAPTLDAFSSLDWDSIIEACPVSPDSSIAKDTSLPQVADLPDRKRKHEQVHTLLLADFHTAQGTHHAHTTCTVVSVCLHLQGQSLSLCSNCTMSQNVCLAHKSIEDSQNVWLSHTCLKPCHLTHTSHKCRSPTRLPLKTCQLEPTSTTTPPLRAENGYVYRVRNCFTLPHATSDILSCNLHGPSCVGELTLQHDISLVGNPQLHMLLHTARTRLVGNPQLHMLLHTARTSLCTSLVVLPAGSGTLSQIWAAWLR